MNINSEATPLLLTATSIWLGYVILLIAVIYHFLLIIPTISVIVRRLHDTHRSGWFVLCLFILPLILLFFGLFLYTMTGLAVFYLFTVIAVITEICLMKRFYKFLNYNIG